MIGSGPIVIGQACEFDYAGCQALKVLREDGYRTIVVNSNPATIMTDPGFADRTYIEPLDLEGVADVLRRERPDALLPTLGGQTALNLAIELETAGVLEELGVELLGAPDRRDPPRRGPRALPRRRCRAAASRCPTRGSSTRSTSSRARPCPRSSAPPSRSAATAAASPTTSRRSSARSSAASPSRPIGQVLVEESVRGWDEFELEVIRDRADNVVIVCSIENLDPMGVHTGDSVTVAPQMTLSDEAYQELRDAAAAVIRAVGVETGGSNIQFARHRETGELRVIEMNPRVSRSSALASKATGYPIAKVAAKLAVGYTLDEIPNDLTKTTPGELRADARLRRRQVPALRLREVPRRRPDARDADEVGRRGDGDRPDVHRGVPQGVRLARARPGLADPVGDDRRHAGRRSTRGSVEQLEAAKRELAHRRHPAREAGGLGRRLDRRGLGDVRRRRAPRALRAGHQALVPARRLLRRRGRGGLELLLLDLGRGGRGAAAGDEAARRDPRLGPEPDRAGDRVRLLLRPRRPDVPRRSATRR